MSDSMTPIDVLVVGVDRWGLCHLKSLKELQEAGEIGDILAYDIDHSKRQTVEELGAIWEPEKRRNHSAAIISSSSETHYEVAMQLIDAGMHVLIEKPMAQTVEEARSLMAAALSKGVHVDTGLLLRHHPAVKQARRLVAEGKIGQIERIHCSRHSTRINSKGESIIDILAIHYLDLCCHLLHEAEPKSLSSEITENAEKISCTISMEYEPGIEAICDVSWGSEKDVKRMQIFGTTDSLTIEFANHEEIIIGNQRIKLANIESPLKAELRSFINRIAAGIDTSTIPQRPALRSVSWKDMLNFSTSGVVELQQH